MSSTAPDAAGQRGVATKLGVKPGDLVQQLGENDDVDESVLPAILAQAGTDLVPADTDDVVDVVLLWFREDDGDLVDALVDARPQLSDTGAIWLLTPKAGREGHVEPADVLEAVPTAGLAQTSTVSVGPDWTAMKLAAPKGSRAPRR
ncbi:MAG TPA: DUF3052 domain-containing protein [Mycobacteriales bacterium]|nr:DUF3052 domain-containing protein [Mycobacteriales bacterium]